MIGVLVVIAYSIIGSTHRLGDVMQGVEIAFLLFVLVAVAVGHRAIAEVIVVDDGSTDDTAEVATAAGARVVRFDHNRGKAVALDEGVTSAKHDIILFLDADVTGHTTRTLSRIMQPVMDGRFEMYVGVRARRTVWLNRLLRIFPIIGGERALTRRLWEAVPRTYKNGYQIEIALNYTAKQFEKGMGFELIEGTVHEVKEKKYGILRGLVGRVEMIADVVTVSFRLYVVGGIVRGMKRLLKSPRR